MGRDREGRQAEHLMFSQPAASGYDMPHDLFVRNCDQVQPGRRGAKTPGGPDDLHLLAAVSPVARERGSDDVQDRVAIASFGGAKRRLTGGRS